LSRVGFVNNRKPFQAHSPDEEAEELKVEKEGDRIEGTPRKGASQEKAEKREKKQEPLTDFKKPIKSHYYS
jgi:hypothetical protein